MKAVDKEGRGFLTPESFAMALKLICKGNWLEVTDSEHLGTNWDVQHARNMVMKLHLRF